jgi:CTP:molybdopterin cytidylyltransferase MocA
VTIGGAILAAGDGTRFGGAKQLAELDGRPLIGHAMEALLAAPMVGRRAVVLGARAEENQARHDLSEWEVVIAEDWEDGISASLRAAVRALSDCDAVVLLLADQPGVTPEVIALIAGELEHGARAARAIYDGAPGHPVLIARELFDEVLALDGDTGAKDLLAAEHARQIEVGHLAAADDVDTPEELEALRR